ncbi:MAG: hypothetical protein ACK4QW_18190, partial [Alphaproteobacteria bacterium]
GGRRAAAGARARPLPPAAGPPPAPTMARLQVEIAEAREAAHVLRAEWAYLNRLDRIRELGTTHLGLAPLGADRIVQFDDLPHRPAAPAAPTGPLVAKGTPPTPAAERVAVRMEGRTR